eukprot:Gb_28271 [translate_table: standard]
MLHPKDDEANIRFVALHLEGIAYEWWLNLDLDIWDGLVEEIYSWEEFTSKLLEIFDDRSDEGCFFTLGNLKQEEPRRLCTIARHGGSRGRMQQCLEKFLGPSVGWLSGRGVLGEDRTPTHQNNAIQGGTREFRSWNQASPVEFERQISIGASNDLLRAQGHLGERIMQQGGSFEELAN